VEYRNEENKEEEQHGEEENEKTIKMTRICRGERR
jgi:hypothetical protein